MLKYFLFIVFLITGTALTGQNKKADAILEDLTKKLDSHKSVGVHFSYILKDANQVTTDEGKGTLLISGDKYRLKIIGQQVFCDGETIWTYIEDAEEVQINTATEEEGVITPSNLLTFYNDHYKAKAVKEEEFKGKTAYIIELKPNEDKNHASVDFYVGKEENEILKIVLFDKNGGTTEYNLDKMNWDIPVKPDDFTFNADDYPDIEVIDMR